jgi:molecular chaperone GrpE
VNDAKTNPDQPKVQPNGKDQPKPAVENSAENSEQLRACAAERDQFKDLAQRTRAEFENYQKRNQRDREQERQYMAGQFVLDILPILDNLERATAAAQKAGEKGPLVQGVGMVEQQFLDILKRYHVTRIEAEGKPFEPHLHQALTHQPSLDMPPDMVLHVVEPGYMLHDRVLRPAKVVVSKNVEIADGAKGEKWENA